MSPDGENNAMVVLTRERRGWRDRARRYAVLVDGEQVATVRRGETIDLAVVPGRHEIYLRISWCRSPSIDIDAHPGQVISMFCAPAGSAAEGLPALGNPGEYISLWLTE